MRSDTKYVMYSIFQQMLMESEAFLYVLCLKYYDFGLNILEKAWVTSHINIHYCGNLVKTKHTQQYLKEKLGVKIAWQRALVRKSSGPIESIYRFTAHVIKMQ